MCRCLLRVANIVPHPPSLSQPLSRQGTHPVSMGLSELCLPQLTSVLFPAHVRDTGLVKEGQLVLGVQKTVPGSFDGLVKRGQMEHEQAIFST